MSTEIAQQQAMEQCLPAKDSCTSPQQSSDEDTTLQAAKLQGEEYAASLGSALQTRTDIVVDFSCLKTCLDPLNSNETTDSEEQQQFDYEEFVYDLFDNQVERLSSVQSLVLRNLASQPQVDAQLDRYAKLCYGMLQLSSLTELDLSGNKIPKEMQANLQLWNLQNLAKLAMDNTSLQSFHASIGRLRKLEVLSLSGNQLSTLPITIGFCENLRVLNLHKNKFRQLPGVILKLKNLQELRRLDNPLTPRYDMHAPHYVRTFQKNPPNEAAKIVYNPLSLQMLCTKKAFSEQIDYWQQTTLGPLQCKTLDRLAADFTLCQNCNGAISDTGRFIIEVMLVTFLGLSGVPFILEACSKECQDSIKDTYSQKNVELQKQLDREYEESVRQALKQADRNEVDISPEAINAPEDQVERFRGPYYHNYRNTSRNRRRRHKRCSIM